MASGRPVAELLTLIEQRQRGRGLRQIKICTATLLIIAFYVFRWARGMLPIAAGLAILLLMIALVAGLGLSGTSWFDRSHAGFAPAQSLFGGNGLSADTLGTITLLLIPVQVLLIVFAMRAFAQGWNVEQEVLIDEARRRGYNPPDSAPPREPATA